MLKSMGVTIGATSFLFLCFLGFSKFVADYANLPEVYISQATSACVKVISEKHRFTCADVDKTLKTYERVVVQ